MTLFQRLKSDPLLNDTQSFVHLLLHRLSISEVIAASKFKKSITDEVGQEPNALKKIREKCKTLNYSEPHTDTIASIFKEILTLAKLIQTAWLIQSKDKSENVVKREAILLAKAITCVEITNENILSSVRETATTLTDQILESLNTPENIVQLDRVTVLLKECFPHIDVSKLEHAVAMMIRGVDALKLAEEELNNTIIIDIGDEGLAVERQRGLRKNSVFKSAEPSNPNPSTVQENTSNWSICTIS